MNFARVFLACYAISGAAAAGSPPTEAEFKELAAKRLCKQSAPGYLTYAGEAWQIDGCLELAPGGEIHELRITSRGGLPSDTLKVVEKYRGHLDHVIVDGLCASSCAAYILPAARRVTVAEHSYVLLTRANNARVIDAERARIVADFHKQMPNAGDEEVNRMVEWGRQKALADAPAEQAFAKQALGCDDWLDPTAPPTPALPQTSTFLLVTPEMAKRCLKSARIESFWIPETQDQFPPGLGIFRARR